MPRDHARPPVDPTGDTGATDDADLDADSDAEPDARLGRDRDAELDGDGDESDEDDLDDDDGSRDAAESDATDPDDAALLDDEFPLGDGVADGVAEVWCPYCGEPNEIVLDPGGGGAQEYVEDCQVCCQPWRVHVTYLADGSAAVTADADDGR